MNKNEETQLMKNATEIIKRQQKLIERYEMYLEEVCITLGRKADELRELNAAMSKELVSCSCYKCGEEMSCKGIHSEKEAHQESMCQTCAL